jgi:hypothetical protein
MRSILERAIEHLLNKDHDKAESLFHKFIVDRARQIHESLRQGDEVSLTEGWDDEIVSEEYFSDADLENTGEAGDDMDSEGDVDTLASDENVDADADTSDVDGDMPDDMDGDVDADGNEDISDKVNDFEAELEKLTAQFKDMIASLDVDGDTSSEDDLDDNADDKNDDDKNDDVDADGEDFSSDVNDDTSSENPEDSDESAVEEDDEDMWENYDLDDITESVIAELEKISIDASVEGKSTDGKKMTPNTKSVLPQKGLNQRDGGSPIKSPFTKNDSMARETPPASKQFPHGKMNSYKRTSDLQKSVEPKGAANAALNKDFAGGAKPTKSPIAGK